MVLPPRHLVLAGAAPLRLLLYLLLRVLLCEHASDQLGHWPTRAEAAAVRHVVRWVLLWWLYEDLELLFAFDVESFELSTHPLLRGVLLGIS